MAETIVKAVRMSIESYQEIQKLADKENRNFSNMCDTLLKESLKQKIKK